MGEVEVGGFGEESDRLLQVEQRGKAQVERDLEELWAHPPPICDVNVTRPPPIPPHIWL